MAGKFPPQGRSTATPASRPHRGRIEEPVSAGGVVYRRVNGEVQMVLCGLILPHRAEAGEDVRWSLPKGTPDPGESLEETALREVREETGLEVRIQEPIKSIDYWFAERGGEVRYHKTVHFYLMVPVGGDLGLHDPEFDLVRWFPSGEALKTLKYANEAEVLRQALKLISRRRVDG